MTVTQERYVQIEKELLAIVFACERFHQYIYGKTVEVQSDHKPLENILKKPLSAAPARLQRMLLRLQKYDIKVVYKQGKFLKVADTLSRAQVADTAEEISEQEMRSQVHLLYAILPCSSEVLEKVHKKTSQHCRRSSKCNKQDGLNRIKLYIISHYSERSENSDTISNKTEDSRSRY